MSNIINPHPDILRLVASPSESSSFIQIMNKIANVVYPYSPKNDDELELQVGDKIEVLGEEEQGE